MIAFKFRFVLLMAGILLTTWFSSMSYGFSCPGSTSIDGCPMGGIGGGNFNFLPGGTYNFTWIRGTADAGAPPLCIAFQKRATTVFSANLQNAGTVTTTFSAYWPTVTEQYASSSMIDGIALKCFSPIIMGDGIASGNKNSSLPIAVYKFTITNTDATAFDTAAIALSNGANATIVRNPAATRVIGIRSPTVCVMVDTSKVNAADSITCGSTAVDFTADGIMNNAAAGILAKRVVVAPSSSRTLYFCVAWTNVANGYYRNYFTDAQALATYGVDNGYDLEAKIDNWHNKILNSNIPDWLKDLAINCMHVFNCMTDWTTPNTYGMVESMSDGLYGTNDQAFHSHFPLALFAPDAAWSQVTRMTSSQYGAGLFGHLYGETGDANVRSDIGQKFVMEVYKDYLWTGNIDKLNALYGNIKGAINGIRSEDRNGDGITDDNFLTTYDNPGWDGWVNPSKEYDNEIFLAALKAAVKAAQATGNTADIATYNAYFAQTSTSFETKFWNSTLASCTGRTGYYQNCSNSGAAHGTAIWDAALMGQWCADVCGLGPLHSESRLQSCYNYISDATLDKRNPPCYSLMMAHNNVNCSGPAPTGTFFNGGSTPYVCYGAYPAGELCGAFYHNLPDIALRALQAYWNIGYSKILRPFNAACKYNLDGIGVDWGQNRYMNPPAGFAAIFGITGFTIDVNAKELRISPAQNPLTGGPLMNPISCGAVDYLFSSTGTPSQNFVIKFDNPMQFNTFITKKRGAPETVEILQPAVGGSPVAATITENSSDPSEYVVTFGSTLIIDNAGVSINIGPPTPKYTLTTEAVNGSISLSPAGGTYGSGTVVTLTATPAAGYAFINWSVDLTGTTNPTTVTMNANMSVTANFSPVSRYTLSTGATNGSVALNPAGGTYYAGTVVTLTAMPAAGYAFSSWSGDVTGTTNPAAVTMNANKSITANFTAQTTVWASDLAWTQVANGWGPVEKDKSNGEAAAGNGKTLTLAGKTYTKGFGCHAVSEITVPLNKGYTSFTSDIGVDDEVGNNGSVTFQVVIDGVTKFTSAKMTGASATQTVTVDVTNATTLSLKVGNGGDNNNSDHADWAGAKLTNAGPRHTLATIATNGTIALNPAGGTYYAGTVVTLTATPAAGYTFGSWSGDLTGTSSPMTITMNGNKTVTANFTPVPQYTLVTSAINGSIGLNPAGLTFNSGTVVTLTATPAAGYAFSNWSGDLTGTANPTTVTMNANKNIIANFTLVQQYTLTTSATNGSISLNPAGGIYNSGTVVTLTATPAAGYAFSGWSGNLSGTTNPATITVNGNKSVTASFTLIPTTTTYEAENLTRTASSAGSNVSTGDANNSNGAYVQLSGTPAVGAWLEFTLPGLKAGAYNIKMYFKANTNRGICQGSVDGTNMGATCDEYRTAAAYQVAFDMGSKALSAGDHKIRYTVTGKNGASAGYTMTIDKIVLTSQ